MKSPLVSVIMPAYNCEPFIGAAIEALLHQTISDFEFIIINDGSTDGTLKKIEEFSDDRILLLNNSQNLGITRSLNRGLDIAKGKYILRTDADDQALPDMMEKLSCYLEANPDYIICGGNMQLMGGDRVFDYPHEDPELKIHTLKACPFSHSTVMIRREVLLKNKLKYNEEIKDGEDHALWSELLPLGKFHNLQSVTLLYRESATQITAQKAYSKNYVNARERIFAFQAATYFRLQQAAIGSYLQLVMGKRVDSIDELKEMGEAFTKALRQNESSQLFDDTLLKRFFFIEWHLACMNSYGFGKEVFSVYKNYVPRTGMASRMKSMGRQFIKMLSA